MNIQRALPWLLLALAVVALDQLTKYLVVLHIPLNDRLPVTFFFDLVHWQNDGAAFNLLADAGGWQRWFFISLAIGFSAYLVFELLRLRDEERVMGWVFGLILGGALGNMCDRIVIERVVDFALFHYEAYYFPAFNVADSALFCGAAFWIWLMIGEYRQAKRDALSENAS